MSPICKCGSRTFWRNYAVSGVWETLVEVNENGELETTDTFTDSLVDSRREPKTIRCTACKQRVPNPDYK